MTLIIKIAKYKILILREIPFVSQIIIPQLFIMMVLKIFQIQQKNLSL